MHEKTRGKVAFWVTLICLLLCLLIAVILQFLQVSEGHRGNAVDFGRTWLPLAIFASFVENANWFAWGYSAVAFAALVHFYRIVRGRKSIRLCAVTLIAYCLLGIHVVVLCACAHIAHIAEGNMVTAQDLQRLTVYYATAKAPTCIDAPPFWELLSVMFVPFVPAMLLLVTKSWKPLFCQIHSQ